MSDKEKKGSRKKGAHSNGAAAKAAAIEQDPEFGVMNSKNALKEFLLDIRDKFADEDEGAAPIHVLSAMNYMLNLPNIYDLLNKENKEIARDVWLRLKQSGMQLRNPPLLFDAEEQPSA